MTALISRTPETVFTADHPDFSMLADSCGFQVSNLIAVVRDGSTRTLGIYNDGTGRTYYREKRSDMAPTGDEGMPSVSNITRERLLSLLPTDTTSKSRDVGVIDPFALAIRMYIDMAVPSDRGLPESRH